MLLRLGIVGLGKAAALMLPSLAAHPHVRLVAAADPNPEARNRFEAEYGGSLYRSSADLCLDANINALYIATPHQQHTADVLNAVAYGKHVLVEKPLALTSADCNILAAAAARAGVVLVVGHSHGFNPSTMLIRSLVHGGGFGQLEMMTNLVYTNFLYRPRRPEELDTARGGGIMYNQVPHQIDIVRTIDGGTVRSVHAVTGVWDNSRPTEGAMTALIEFADGVAATLVYSGYDHFDSDELHEWIGESGTPEQPKWAEARRAIRALGSPEAEMRARSAAGFAGQGSLRVNGTAGDPHFGFLLVSCEGADLRPSPRGVRIYSDRGIRELPAAPARSYPNKDSVIDEFYDAIVSGEPPLHDGLWGTETMRVVEALQQSARERRQVLTTPE